MPKKPDRNCPDCGEVLSAEADRCGACGWLAKGARRRVDAHEPRHNMRCTWHVMGLPCQNPVSLFVEGATRNFCLLHRHRPEGSEAAAIAEASAHISPEEFLERCKVVMYGLKTENGVHPDNQNVAKLRQRLRKDVQAGNFGNFRPARTR